MVEEKRGAVLASMALLQDAIEVDGKRVRLTPGRNGAGEIRTGSRRVIEFLLSPIQRAVSESGRER